MDKLKDCYERIKRSGFELEDYQVIDAVRRHRDYWRPTSTQVVLLAESHVWTTQQDFACKIDVQRFGLSDYPRNYVRLVYDLGYGEDELLDGFPNKNSGTPQYWKIFYATCNRIKANIDCSSVMKTSNRELVSRISAKVELLRKMRQRGIWLMDASIVSLYKPGGFKPSSVAMQQAIEVSWDHYIADEIMAINPRHVICVGIKVFKTLETRLRRLFEADRVSCIAQPQAHISAQQHLANLSHCFDVCERHANRSHGTHA
jgi:hypothetical protein